jgi:hypothetical protein
MKIKKEIIIDDPFGEESKIDDGVWYGHVNGIDDGTLIIILKKDFHLMKILTMRMEKLNKKQKELVSIGSIIKYDLKKHKIRFMDNDGISWV